MSLLSRVQTGVIQRPHYILMHGLPGLGKTTFASKAPKPIFLCAEDGTHHLDVARVRLNSLREFTDILNELNSVKHEYETVVIDTVDHLEPLIWSVVAKDQGKKAIEDIGYAKGYIYALDYWSALIAQLEDLRDNGMNVVLLAHTEVKTFNDPQLSEGYDRYQIKLHQKAASLLVDRVECVLFANYKTFTNKSETGKIKGLGDGTRVVYTEHRPAFVAKNRFDLPFELPLDWGDFDSASRRQEVKSPADIRENIEILLPQIKDESIRKSIEKFLSEVGDDAKKLIAAENRIKTIISAA